MFNQSTIDQVGKIAKRIGVEHAALLAIAEVEANGSTQWNVRGRPVPPMRFEGHVFYKRLAGDKRRRAVSAGLANPRSGRVKNPRSYEARYGLLSRAMKIDGPTALESCSWGLGQVMGYHWSKLGYDSVSQLVDMCGAAEGQVDLMARYVVEFGLLDELRGKKWAKFARAYNGKGYRKNRYDTKMAAAYRKWVKKLGGAATTSVADERVRDIQRKLKKLGYFAGKVDGFERRDLIDAVRAFQNDNGLVVDGKHGPMTEEELNEQYEKALKKRNDGMTTGIGTGIIGAGGVGEAVLDKATVLQHIGVESWMLDTLFIGLTVIGLGLILYGLYNRFKKDTSDA